MTPSPAAQARWPATLGQAKRSSPYTSLVGAEVCQDWTLKSWSEFAPGRPKLCRILNAEPLFFDFPDGGPEVSSTTLLAAQALLDEY
jgi:hypothetical protein